METIIIAEIGENHYGQWDLCRGMVEEVAANGATYAKFQTYTAEQFGKNHVWYKEFRKVEMPAAEHFEMQRLCAARGIGFMCSTFTRVATSFLLDRLGCRELKLASSRVTDLSLLQYVNSRADQVQRVFLSTGMSTLKEVREAVKQLARIEELYLLHCTSQYPTEDENVNLRAIRTLQEAFPDFPVGFSDHSRGIEACIAAVALGAVVLEKHFTYHRHMPGDDHEGAMTPAALAELVQAITRLEHMMGGSEKNSIPAEAKAIAALRVEMREVGFD